LGNRLSNFRKQSDFVVVGIDVAKDKVDACIRSLSQRQTFP
jgi:transposase